MIIKLAIKLHSVILRFLLNKFCWSIVGSIQEQSFYVKKKDYFILCLTFDFFNGKFKVPHNFGGKLKILTRPFARIVPTN
jgi:hypothetical protein